MLSFWRGVDFFVETEEANSKEFICVMINFMQFLLIW
jgi:hypothetical protein